MLDHLHVLKSLRIVMPPVSPKSELKFDPLASP